MKVAQVEAIIGRMKAADPALNGRIAFLVTFEELDDLCDEIQTGNTNVPLIDAEEEKRIRIGKAGLIINEVPVLPELFTPLQQLRGRPLDG